MSLIHYSVLVNVALQLLFKFLITLRSWIYNVLFSFFIENIFFVYKKWNIYHLCVCVCVVMIYVGINY